MKKTGLYILILLLVLCGCTDTDVMPKMGREVYVQLNLMATPATKAGQIPVGALISMTCG